MCMKKYYESGGVCVGCHHSCASCVSATACGACEGIYGRYQVTTGVGYCLCAQGYYDDGTN